MKAAVCYEMGQPLIVEEIEIDPPQRGEVRVRLAATAICHSDVHAIRGDWGGVTPVVAGHEAAGVVEEVGDGVTMVQLGDHVVVTLLRSCGQCAQCSTGSPHLCEGDFALNNESRLRNRRGESILQGTVVGAFAEEVIVDQSQLVIVPDDMPLDQAALLACGVITGAGAVLNTAQVEPGRSVVVIGCGGVGLNAVQGAALASAYPIIAVDLLASKLDAARTFGATHTVNASEHGDPVEAVKALVPGLGADYVFVTVGSARAAEQGFGMLGRNGLEVIVGLPEAGATITLPAGGFASRGAGGPRKVMGSFMGSTRLRADIPRLLAFYKEGRLKLEELITARYPLGEINQAVESMERGEALRNVIIF